MELAELDTAIEELEVRLERLRALYEQYFLGIEKIEPSVARKDVDRRIWALRREQIRNTGRRFRLNNVILRYNTFQQYWTRTCRQIENGTYHRHLLRAQKTVGDTGALTIAARKRFGIKGARDAAQEAQENREEAKQKARAAVGELERELDASLEQQLDPVEDLRRAMDEALGTSAPAGPASRSGPVLVPSAPPVPAGFDAYALPREGADDDLESIPAATMKQKTVPASRVPPPTWPSAVPPAGVRPGPSAESPTGSVRSLPAPKTRLSRPPPAAAARLARPSHANGTEPSRGSAPGARPEPGGAVPARAPPPPPRRQAPAGAHAHPLRTPSDKPPGLPRSSITPVPGPVSRPGTSALPVRLPNGDRLPRSEAQARAAATSPPLAAQQAIRAVRTRAERSGLSDQRISELHAQLLEVKRKTKDAGTVTEKQLARSLRAAESKLKNQHGQGRRVDFNIIIKNGRAVVKPIVR